MYTCECQDFEKNFICKHIHKNYSSHVDNSYMQNIELDRDPPAEGDPPLTLDYDSHPLDADAKKRRRKGRLKSQGLIYKKLMTS